VNIGHGEEDKEQYDNLGEIFAVEGAVPVFRKEALLSCKIMGEIADHDFFWYGDDLDLAWRMRLFGWKQVFAPNVIAWHDRQTTKTLKKSWLDYLMRVPIRRQIPIRKRRLDWRNLRWTLVKNDYIINILKDLPWIVSREIAVLGYTILFEPEVLKEIPAFFRYLPNMFRKRKEIMKKAVLSPKEIRKWIYG
jgi:GT2 family glycosyltransferase